MTVDGRESESPPTVETPEVSETSVTNSDVKTETAESSTPAKDVSLLDAVKAAIKPKAEGSSPSQEQDPKVEGTETSQEGEEPDPDSDPTEEELKRYHSKTRKQVSRLLRQRNEFRTQAEQLKPDADGFRKLVSFASDAGISTPEMNLLLDVGRNLKKDPHKALEQLKPYYDALLRITGEALPDDLRVQVDRGELNEAHARELSKTRSRAQYADHRVQETSEQQRKQQQQTEWSGHVQGVQQTISTWETNQAKNDPDWKLKQGRVGQLIENYVLKNGFPKTAQDAVTIADNALKAVNDDLKAYMPRKTAVTPVNSAASTRSAMPKPTSAMEAARQGLARARAG